METSTKSVVTRSWVEVGMNRLRGFLSSENTLCDIVTMDMGHYTKSIEYTTSSESLSKVWTLDDYNVSM